MIHSWYGLKQEKACIYKWLNGIILISISHSKRSRKILQMLSISQAILTLPRMRSRGEVIGRVCQVKRG